MANALPPSWLGVEPRHLAALQAIAQHQSFRAAARALGYSQPAVSQIVSQLERMLGLPLVERHPGSASAELTDQGQVLLTHATSILHSFGAAQADLSALTGQRARVGMLASLAPRLLTAVLHADITTPEIVEAGDDAELARLVAGGEVEIAFGEPPRVGPFAVQLLGIDPYVLAIPCVWPLAGLDGRPAFEMLERLPLIARTDGAAAARISGQLLARGIEPCWAAHADSDLAALALVRAGSGAAIVPRSAIETWDESIASVPLDGVLAPRTICRYVHSDRRLSDDVEAIASAAGDALNAGTRPKPAVAA